MVHNFCLEASICISKDSFEILRLSALIWAQTETLYAETGEKIVLEVYQWQFILSVSIISHFGLFQYLSYCHVSLHISDNLSPNLKSSDITGKQRSRAFIWHQA